MSGEVGGGLSGYDRMNETHLSVFHSEKRVSSAARYAFNSDFKPRARDFTTFTLHDLTDFYVEMAACSKLKHLLKTFLKLFVSLLAHSSVSHRLVNANRILCQQEALLERRYNSFHV